MRRSPRTNPPVNLSKVCQACFPAFEEEMHLFLIIMPLIAEIWLLGYLLLVGVKAVKPAKGVLPAAVAITGAQA